MKDEIWTMRDGSAIVVGDMSEQHAKNALRMILRNRRQDAVSLIATDDNESARLDYICRSGRDEWGDA